MVRVFLYVRKLEIQCLETQKSEGTPHLNRAWDEWFTHIPGFYQKQKQNLISFEIKDHIISQYGTPLSARKPSQYQKSWKTQPTAF